jgi:hypothetical protein
MNSPCILTPWEKIDYLASLYSVQRHYLQAVYRAELDWQLHVHTVNLAENGVSGEYDLEYVLQVANTSRHAIRAAEEALTAKVAELQALGLDLGIDHLITQAEAA